MVTRAPNCSQKSPKVGSRILKWSPKSSQGYQNSNQRCKNILQSMPNGSKDRKNNFQWGAFLYILRYTICIHMLYVIYTQLYYIICYIYVHAISILHVLYPLYIDYIYTYISYMYIYIIYIFLGIYPLSNMYHIRYIYIYICVDRWIDRYIDIYTSTERLGQQPSQIKLLDMF